MHLGPSQQKGLRLIRDVHVEGLSVRCDRERILQVFGNLLGNAIKFCRPGDTITVSAKRDRGHVHRAHLNTGPGIPAEDLSHIFVPYWSAERHAKKGLGLGLYIAKGIVEAHGSDLEVRSEAGSGATFTFTLPLASG